MCCCAFGVCWVVIVICVGFCSLLFNVWLSSCCCVGSWLGVGCVGVCLFGCGLLCLCLLCFVCVCLVWLCLIWFGVTWCGC